MAEANTTPGQQTVDFAVLVKKVSEESCAALKELTKIAPEQTDSDRKLSLLKHILRTRQRLLRLLVLSKWCRQIPLVERCQQLTGTLSNHDTSFTQAADFLYFLHDGLQQARAPMYDITTAAEVLLTGNYSRLPKCVEDLAMPATLTGEERDTTLHKLDTMLRSRLLDISLPKELSSIVVSNGRIAVRVHGEFEVQLTLGYRGYISMWRILHLQLLVGESTGPTDLTEKQRLGLGEDLERRMAASDDPFGVLYTILHEFCTTLVTDTLFRQTGLLRQGRWKDAIRYEKISEPANANQGGNIGQGTGQGPGPGPPGDMDLDGKGGLKSRGTTGLKIWYWLDCPKGIAGVDPSSPPHLRIEPGPDHSLVCSHQPPVMDPATDNDAEFIIDQSTIDVERLLLRAMACNIHTRLLEVRRGLRGSTQLWRVDSDVVLKSSSFEDGDEKDSPGPEDASSSSSSGEAGEEVLCVRAYGNSFVALGISIRNGRYLLRSSGTLLANTVLGEMEDALNQGSIPPIDVFVNLRSRSLLCVFASMGSNFNLKIYERGASALKFPPDLSKLTSEVLVMGFPNCEEVYFLALHLDANFMPRFKLLEGQPRSLSGRAGLLSGPIKIIGSMAINIETVLVSEDDASFSLLGEGRLEVERHSISGVNLRRVVAKDTQEVVSRKGGDLKILGRGPAVVPGLDGSQAEFSSVTDRYHRGSPAGHLSRSNNPLSPSFSPAPSPSGLQGMATTNQQFGGSNMMSQGLNGSFSPGNAGPIQSNHRVGRMGLGDGVMASPVRSPLHRVSKSPYHGDQDLLQSKSPLHAGESASSPIDLDDISKLIDSIALKTSVLPGSHPSPVGESGSLSSRQQRMNASRIIPMVKSPGINPRTPQAKVSSLQALTSGRVTGPSANSIARMGSPRKHLSSQAGSELTSEWMEVDQSSQSVQSPMHLPSPSTRPSTIGTQYGTRPALAIGMSPSDSLRRKRCGAELFFSLPSVQGVAASAEKSKRRKTECESSQSLVGQSVVDVVSSRTLPVLDSFVGQPYSTIIAAANQGKAPMGSYTTVLLQVVRRCWLCIKHSRLTRQMDALSIPYVEEIGFRRSSSNLRFRLPAKDTGRNSRRNDPVGWQQICLYLGKPGSDGWEVEVQDVHYKGLWELQKHFGSSSGGPSVQLATLPEEDSHIRCSPKGLVLSYSAVQDDSIKKMVADLERLWNARMFALGLRRLLEGGEDKAEGSAERLEGDQGRGSRSQSRGSYGERNEGGEKKWEVMRRAFRVDAVGLTSTWFSYVGFVSSLLTRFVVEWEVEHNGCTVHVSPEQLWPHTKYLEDYINGGEVELLLDCIRTTVGPLSSLAAAIRPARMLNPPPNAATPSTPIGTVMSPALISKPATPGSILSPSAGPTSSSGAPQVRLPNGSTATLASGSMSGTVQSSQGGGLASGPGRPVSGLVPSSLLPTDVSVLLRTPYWIRIVYRKQFAMDMRCFAGDQVWLQPSPPPRSGVSGAGGSLPCPQFRPFVMEHVGFNYTNAENPGPPSGNGGSQVGFSATAGNWGAGITPSTATATATATGRTNAGAVGGPRLVSNAVALPNRVGNLQGSAQALAGNAAGMGTNPGRGMAVGSNLGMRGEYTALFGLGDDGGYGGAWVPMGALKKVLRGTLRYLGVLWLFAQFPAILRDVLGSILKENEGALLNHDPEQPALRFFIGNCVFAVSMHRQQLYLQAINVKKFQQQQQQQQGQGSGPDSELSSPEMAEIGDFFARRVASEPYDASRLASFVMMLTLPVPVLREFLKLIGWKKEQQRSANHGGDGLASPRPKIEICLENRVGAGFQSTHEDTAIQGSGLGGGPSVAKSTIHHYRAQSTVEFTLTLYLDAANLPPPINVAGGAGWLPHCVAVRLRYQYSEPHRVTVVSVEGSHGGRACWHRAEDWDRCKVSITRAVDLHGSQNLGEPSVARLRNVAELVQVTVQKNVMQLRRGVQNAASPMTNSFSSQS